MTQAASSRLRQASAAGQPRPAGPRRQADGAGKVPEKQQEEQGEKMGGTFHGVIAHVGISRQEKRCHRRRPRARSGAAAVKA